MNVFQGAIILSISFVLYGCTGNDSKSNAVVDSDTYTPLIILANSSDDSVPVTVPSSAQPVDSSNDGAIQDDDNVDSPDSVPTDDAGVTEQVTDQENASTPNQPTRTDGGADTSAKDGPAEPIGLTGVVYTDTEIELFWERSTDRSIMKYRILRDGVLLQTRDGLSYYDNTVQPATTYEYTVESVDYNDKISDPVSLMLTTPEVMPIINSSNAESLLGYMATISNGAVFAEMLSIVDSLEDNAINRKLVGSGFVAVSEQFSEQGAILTEQYNCDLGGKLTLGTTQSALPSYQYSITNCDSNLFNNNALNGSIAIDRTLSKFVYNSGVDSTLSMDEFSITDTSADTSVITGVYGKFGGQLNHWQFTEKNQIRFDGNGAPVINENGGFVRDIDPFTYDSPAFEGRTTIAITSITRSRGVYADSGTSDFSHTLSIDFTLQSAQTGNKPIVVTTPEPFSSNAVGDCFSVGQMKMFGSDGSELLLDADTGSLDTVQLTITNYGVSTTQTIPWSASLAFMHATPDNIIDSERANDGSAPAYIECVN